MAGSEPRAVEVHIADAWDRPCVAKALDSAARNRLNTLVLHREA